MLDLHLIEHEIVITGSYNFSASAEGRNDEITVIVHSAEIAALYLAEFGRLFGSPQPQRTLIWNGFLNSQKRPSIGRFYEAHIKRTGQRSGKRWIEPEAAASPFQRSISTAQAAGDEK